MEEAGRMGLEAGIGLEAHVSESTGSTRASAGGPGKGNQRSIRYQGQPGVLVAWHMEGEVVGR